MKTRFHTKWYGGGRSFVVVKKTMPERKAPIHAMSTHTGSSPSMRYKPSGMKKTDYLFQIPDVTQYLDEEQVTFHI